MGVYIGGVEYDKIYIGGREVSRLLLRGQTYKEPAAVDRPGVFTVSVARVGRDYNFTFSITDPDGIRSITSAVVTANDGRTADALGDFSRSDANTFGGTDSRRNARWSSGTFAVTYVDAASGESRTVTVPFST